MKKITILFLSILLAWTFSSCSKSDTKPAINFNSLKTDIAAAQNLIVSTTEGINPGDYPAGSKATLSAAIAVAQTVVTTTSTTQPQEVAADAQLLVAIEAYKTTILATLINEVAVAQDWSNANFPGKPALLAAIATANSIIDQGGSTITPSQEAAATDTLIAAVAAFKDSQIIVWFFGDSITAGWENGGPNPNPNNRWTSLLCAQKHWTEVNSGVAGETLLQASEDVSPNFSSFFARYQNDIPTKPPHAKYIFISYGGNDTGLNFADYTTSLFSTQLQTIITYANTKGWQNSNIVVLCGYFFNSATWTNPWGPVQLPAAATMDRYFSFIAAAQTVAQNNSGVTFVNPFNSYDATGISDGAHPNDKGYAAIAAYVATQFQ